MNWWEKEIVITDEMEAAIKKWHASKFPKCRAGIKMNNHCNHIRWFLYGCLCMQEQKQKEESGVNTKETNQT